MYKIILSSFWQMLLISAINLRGSTFHHRIYRCCRYAARRVPNALLKCRSWPGHAIRQRIRRMSPIGRGKRTRRTGNRIIFEPRQTTARIHTSLGRKLAIAGLVIERHIRSTNLGAHGSIVVLVNTQIGGRVKWHLIENIVLRKISSCIWRAEWL